MKKKTPAVATAPVTDRLTPSQSFDGFLFTSRQLLIATLLLAGLYFLYSLVSTGFYQQDEAAHFVSMRGFWYNPNSILSNWAKPGYKLLYALPSLLGINFVKLVNCLVAAFSCFFAYKIAEILNKKVAIVAFAATALQPLWISLAFRNYSEIIGAFLLTAAVLMHLKNKYLFAALLASYLAFIRQEFYPFLALYFVFLVWKKEYTAALLLGTFPLIHNTWGAILKGDPLYLLNDIIASGKQIGDAWPRQGFDHYFKMSVTVYGAAAVTLVITYTAIKIFKKEHPVYIVFLPVVLYFLMHSLFNLQMVHIGAAGGGNLRYILVISPLVGVLAALAVEEIGKVEKNWQLLTVLLIFALAVAIFMTYKHNLIVFKEEMGRDWMPLLGVVLTILLLLIPLTLSQRITSLSATMAFVALVSVKPIKLAEEDKTCRQLAGWYKDFEKKDGQRQVFVDHAMFNYYIERSNYEFTPEARNLTLAALQKAPKGSVIIWDTHYSYRPEWKKDCINFDYFQAHQTEYRLLQQFQSADERFAVIVLEKQ